MKNVKKNGGFTLVELIVVIAILAILAAVAIPAYSGDIEKAEKANDLQLLGAVNQAFGAACVENNIFDMTTVEGTVISLDSNGYIVGMNVKESLSNAPTIDTTGNPVLASFIRFYGDNINTPFKYFHTKLTYTKDGFEGMEPGEKDTGLYGEVINELLSTGKISQETINAIKNSEFGDIGAENLLSKVFNVTELSNLLANGDPATGASAKESYQQFLLGGETDLQLALVGSSYDELVALMEEDEDAAIALLDEAEAKYNALVAAKVAGGMSESAAKYELLTNHAVLSAAANTDTSITAAQLGASIANDTLTATTLKSLMKNEDPATSREALGNAAMLYGMYTAWANNLDADDPNKASAEANAATLDGFISDMKNPDFLDYLQNDSAAEDDLAGYKAAMDIINKSSSDQNAVAELVANGYNDPTLIAALQGLLK